MVDPKDCLFCKIVKGEIPAKKVYEDANVIAFLDINPRNPGHTLVIPKDHHETLFDLPDADIRGYFSSMKRVAVLVRNGTKAHGISVCQNNGSAAGQVVAHLHFHIIPRFMNEGPSALEGILQVKKMNEEALDQIASAIKGASSEAPKEMRIETEEKPKERPKPVKKKKEKPVAPVEKPKEKPKEKPVGDFDEDEEDDKDEFEEINFNF
jgi:histidine triad (HIT) family protein